MFYWSPSFLLCTRVDLYRELSLILFTSSDTRTEKDMSFDKNGNLTALKRYGATGLENDLTFTLSGKRMTSISDAGSPGGTFSFSYDALGNLTNDGRKGLVISYNGYYLTGILKRVRILVRSFDFLGSTSLYFCIFWSIFFASPASGQIAEMILANLFLLQFLEI